MKSIVKSEKESENFDRCAFTYILLHLRVRFKQMRVGTP